MLDRTHVRFWGLRNIQKLFEEAGLKIVEAEFVVKAPEQTEFADRWRKLPSSVREALAWNRFGNVYQVVLRAVLQVAPGASLQLESMSVSGPAKGNFGDWLRGNRVLRYFISFLSGNARARISRALRRLGIGH